MELYRNTILITGGSEGIGLELARQLAPTNAVIICGRSREKLDRARAELPSVATVACDLTVARERHALVEHVLREHPELNVIVNNAGGRQQVDLTGGEGLEAARELDLALNFTAPADLCGRLVPHLLGRPTAAVVNVTTGLVYLPKAAQPFYCAAKAALHSYTQSLRWALRGSSVRVFELLIPLVDTQFHKGRLPESSPAISAAEAARLSLRGIRRDEEEVFIGKAAAAKWLSTLWPSRGLEIVNR